MSEHRFRKRSAQRFRARVSDGQRKPAQRSTLRAGDRCTLVRSNPNLEFQAGPSTRGRSERHPHVIGWLASPPQVRQTNPTLNFIQMNSGLPDQVKSSLLSHDAPNSKGHLQDRFQRVRLRGPRDRVSGLFGAGSVFAFIIDQLRGNTREDPQLQPAARHNEKDIFLFDKLAGGAGQSLCQRFDSG